MRRDRGAPDAGVARLAGLSNWVPEAAQLPVGSPAVRAAVHCRGNREARVARQTMWVARREWIAGCRAPGSGDSLAILQACISPRRPHHNGKPAQLTRRQWSCAVGCPAPPRGGAGLCRRPLPPQPAPPPPAAACAAPAPRRSPARRERSGTHVRVRERRALPQRAPMSWPKAHRPAAGTPSWIFLVHHAPPDTGPRRGPSRGVASCGRLLWWELAVV